MRKIILAIALAALLGGCATLARIDAGWQAVKSSTVSPAAVVVAANTFNALEATATNYLRLKKCTGANGPICRDPAVTAKVIPAVRAGRAARDSLIAFQKAHPGALGDQGVYDALQSSIGTLTSIINTYGGAK